MPRGPSARLTAPKLKKSGCANRLPGAKKSRSQRTTLGSPTTADAQSLEEPVQQGVLHGVHCISVDHNDDGETFFPCLEAFSDDDEGEEEDTDEEDMDEPDATKKDKGEVNYVAHPFSHLHVSEGK